MGHEITDADVETIFGAFMRVGPGAGDPLHGAMRALLERLGKLDAPPKPPTPGMILLEHARAVGTPDEVRAAVLRVLEPAYNVVEYDGLARVEEERGDASHVTHAVAQRAKWLRQLDEALGPVLDEFVELAQARDHGAQLPLLDRANAVRAQQVADADRVHELPNDSGSVASNAARLAGDDSESHYAAPAVMAELRKTVLEGKHGSITLATEAVAVELPQPAPLSLGALDDVLTEEEAQLARVVARLTGYVPMIQFRYEDDRRVDCTLTYRFVAQWDEKREWRNRVVNAPDNVRPADRALWCLREAARCVRLEHRKDV
jgi:hypothetical protein